MAVNSTRAIAIHFTGDAILDKIYSATDNPLSPGADTIHALSAGDNTITVPSVTGYSVKGATIVPPSGNLQAIILKGDAADVGITLSKLDPTSLGFETAPASFILNAGGAIDGLRIIWT